MHSLRYDTVKHGYAEQPWAVDHDGTDNPCRYKEPVHGLRVWEGDRVTIAATAYRSPDVRRKLQNKGIDVRLLSQLVGIRLFSPDGEETPKSWLKPGTVLLDHTFHMCLGLNWRDDIVYLTPGAMPFASGRRGGGIAVYKPNIPLEKERWAANEEFLKQCATMYALRDDTKGGGLEYSLACTVARRYLTDIFSGANATKPDPVENRMVCEMIGCFAYAAEGKERLRNMCISKLQYDHLKFEVAK